MFLQADRQTNWWATRQTERQIDTQADKRKLSGRHADGLTETDGQTQTDGPTGKEGDRPTG